MPNEGVFVTWFGQAAFRLETADARVLIDPFLSDRPDRLYPPPVSPRDLVDTTLLLCTHEHDDHLDLDFVRALFAAGGHPQMVVPAPVRSQVLDAGLPAGHVVGAVPDKALTFAATRVYPVPSYHGIGGGVEPVAYGFTSLAAPDEGYRFLGYVVEVGGVRLYHAGDTLVYPGMADRIRRLAPDVLMLPINGRDFYREAQGTVGNMNEGEAAQLALDIGGVAVVPMHYEGFANNVGDVGRFMARIPEGSGPTVVRLARNRPFWFPPASGRPREGVVRHRTACPAGARPD